jgi:hypothetical protein
MKTRSAKAKGRKLQQEVRDIILEAFTELEPDDVVSTTMGDSGVDLKLSPAARKKFPYSVECKNQEALSIWKCLEQAEYNTKPGTAPLLVFRRNRSKTYVSLPIEDFMKLLAPEQSNEPKATSDNSQVSDGRIDPEIA